MTETLFAFDEHNYRECQDVYRGTNEQEYYLGDYSIEGGSVIDVRADRKTVGSSSIIRLRSKTRLLFRRNWSHIRQDATDRTVLWLVKRGRLCVSHPAGFSAAQPGDFLITRSMTPFFIECQTDEESVHEVLHVVLPTHVFRTFVPNELRTGFCAPAEGRKFALIERILLEVFEDESELPEDTAKLLVDSALSVLGAAIKDRGLAAPARQSVSDLRLKDVLRFIDVHLSDPGLSIATVAKGCGISPRYLFSLLKLYGTPFSVLVWQKRLDLAKRWLSSSAPGDISISEIAYRTGFKSPAHFSRMFKRVYKASPRECRSSGGSPVPYNELFSAYGGSFRKEELAGPDPLCA